MYVLLSTYFVNSPSQDFQNSASLWLWCESKECQKGKIRECPHSYVSILFLGSVPCLFDSEEDASKSATAIYIVFLNHKKVEN